MRFHQPGALGVVLSFILKPLKCKFSCAVVTLPSFPLQVFVSLHMLSWFSNGVQTLAFQTLASSVSLAKWGKGRWRVRGEGVPQPPCSHSPPLLWSLSPASQPHPNIITVTQQPVTWDSTVQTRLLQIPRCLPVVFGLFCFVLFFYSSNNHSTYYCSSLQCYVQTPQLCSFFFFVFNLKKNAYTFYW